MTYPICKHTPPGYIISFEKWVLYNTTDWTRVAMRLAPTRFVNL